MGMGPTRLFMHLQACAMRSPVRDYVFAAALMWNVGRTLPLLQSPMTSIALDQFAHGG
jgi:hypothetical protein